MPAYFPRFVFDRLGDGVLNSSVFHVLLFVLCPPLYSHPRFLTMSVPGSQRCPRVLSTPGHVASSLLNGVWTLAALGLLLDRFFAAGPLSLNLPVLAAVLVIYLGGAAAWRSARVFETCSALPHEDERAVARNRLPMTSLAADPARREARAAVERREGRERNDDDEARYQCLDSERDWKFYLFSDFGSCGVRSMREGGTFSAPSLDGGFRIDPDLTAAKAASFRRNDFIFCPPSEAERKMSRVRVPGHWTLHEDVDDIPRYTNIQYPFDVVAAGGPPFVPRRNPTGWYRRTFARPKSWGKVSPGEQYILNVGAAEAAHYVFLNGTFVGYGTDSRLPSCYDVTSFLNDAADDVLDIVVPRWSAGTYLEDQDHWYLAGLFRSVGIHRQRAGEDVVDAVVERADADGSVVLRVDVRKYSKPSGGRRSVYCALTDPGTGRKAWTQTATVSEDGSGEETVQVRLQGHVENVRTWTAETPHLYDLTLELRRDPNDNDRSDLQLLQTETLTVGFRTVAVDQTDNLLKINGRPITVCGVNRHEHDPVLGKAVTVPSMLEDVLLLKQHNFNAVRCAHYPNHPAFYALCDYYGLYVVDEANFEVHGMQPMGCIANSPSWGPAIRSRIARTVARDRNHPSIILWSLGNEAGRGRAVQKAADELRAADPTRPVQYESGGACSYGTGDGPVTDIACPMYPSVPEAIAAGTEKTGRPRPLILCEYSHAMGNSNGNVDQYWEAFWDEGRPRMQGGFVWDMVDQGLQKTDQVTGKKYWAYGGDFGDRIHDGNFCINGLFLPDRTPKPAAAELKRLQQPIHLFVPNGSETLHIHQNTNNENNDENGDGPALTIATKNRYSFLSSFDHLCFCYKIITDVSAEPIASGKCRFDHDSRHLVVDRLAIKTLWQKVDALSASFRAPQNVWIRVTTSLRTATTWADVGHIVAEHQLPLRLPVRHFVPTHVDAAAKNNDRVGSSSDDFVILEDTDFIKVAVRGKNIVRVNKRTASLSKFYSIFDGSVLMGGGDDRDDDEAIGLVPNFTRAATDNDLGGVSSEVESFPLNLFARTKMASDYISFQQQWKMYGLSASDPPSLVCRHISANVVRSQIDDEGPPVHCVKISASVSVTTSAGRPPSELAVVETIYHIFNDGTLRLDQLVLPTKFLHSLPSLPRLGLAARLPPSLCNVVYCGRGPHENYPDRHHAADTAVYHSSPSSMYVPYVRPSEHGSRSNCTWVSFMRRDQSKGSARGGGLRVEAMGDSGTATFSFGAGLYSQLDLERARHTCDLPHREEGEDDIFVNFDHRIMGIGGDCSWLPCVYPEFMVQPKGKFSYSLKFTPIGSKCD